MGSSDYIALVLIVALALIALVCFIIQSHGKSHHINSLLKAHSSKIELLLNREELPTSSTLSEVDINLILSLSHNDWLEWDELIKRVGKLVNLYPYTVYEFINKYTPKFKEKNFYKKNVTPFMPIPQKVNVAISSMLLDELRVIDGDSEETWKQRDELRIIAYKIKQEFPEGYKTYCEIHKSSCPRNAIIARDKNHIAELQKIYAESKGYEGWEKKQEVFSSKYRQILKDARPQDGRYPYHIPFKKPNRRGILEESKFKIWQGFCESFSSFLLDCQTANFKSKYNKIAEFGRRSRYFYDHVYDEIYEIINKFDEEVSRGTCVILIDKCNFDWSKETYDYHYEHLRELLADAKFNYFNFSDLPLINDNGNIGGVFIMDFVTTNDELLHNCKLIIEHFNKSVPLLGYYSMEKEYDEEELLKLAESQEGYLVEEDDEESDIEFIKSKILQVNKHPFYSFLAVPNTWIGEAVGAEETKKQWLDNPDLYYFKTKDEEGCISGEFSVDGGNNSYDLSIIGDRNDIDDTARFTYLLFKEMEILNVFKKNGHKAVGYMNTMGFLAHH